MSDNFLPFCKPSINADDIEAVVKVLRSGWITTGQVNTELEQAFCERFSCRHAIAVSSATAAMHLALSALDIGPGDEVITPSMTWVSTPNLTTLLGARPVFVDVDRDTLMCTRKHIDAAITPRTKAIIPVHFAGASLNLEPIRSLAKQYRLPIIEDAAHALGTHYQGKAIGAQGTAIFSLHPIKNITSGEGGVLCTDDSKMAERVRRLRFHGLGADAYDRATQSRSPVSEVQEPGYKYNLPDINAALGLSQLKRLEQLNARRSALAERYLLMLEGQSDILPLQRPDYDFKHAWHLFVVRLGPTHQEGLRDRWITRLKTLGIGTGIHFRAVHTHAWYRDNQPQPSDTLTNTQWNSERLFSLPLFPDMHDSDVNRVVAALLELSQEEST